MRETTPSRGDLVAGVSVALVAIPQSLAYAELAGLPPQYGLYASALPSIAAAFFVSSRFLQTGPVALTSLLTFGALSSLEDEFTPNYIALAALLALLVGAARVILGVLRLGRLAYLLSEPVLTGFTTGAAILIMSSQLPKVFDADTDGRGVLPDALQAVVEVDGWHWSAIGFAVLSVVLIVGGRRIHPIFPGVLIAVVVSIVISGVTGYDGSVVGELEGGFVSLGLDVPWSEAGSLIVPALAIALVGFAEPSSIARTFAAEDREPWDADREMVSQGVANVVSGLSGAFPVGGSFSRSSLNRMAGATSAWAGAVTGVVVLAALPLTGLLADLPQAVLGAIVIVAVVKLVRLGDIVRMYAESPAQTMVAAGTLLATLASAPRVERGVIVGIGLAIAAHLYREMSVSAGSSLEGDRLVVSPQGVMWFATVPTVERLMRNELARHPEVAEVVLDLGGVGRLDYTGAAALGRIFDDLRAGGVTVRTINVPPGARRAVGIHLSASHDDPGPDP